MADWWEQDKVVETEEDSSNNFWEQDAPVNNAESETVAALAESQVALPYNAAQLLAEREQGVSDSALVDALISQGASVLQVNDQNFDIAAARKDGVRDDEIMQILTTGKAYSNVDSQADAVAQGAYLGLSNIVGAPVDLINWGGGQIERGGRAIYNQFVDEENQVGTDLRDTKFYSEYPYGGSENIRDGFSAFNEALGGNELIDSIEELSPEYRAAAQAGRVAGESVIMLTPFALARAGKAVSHPLVAMAANSPRTLLATEAVATGGAAQGAAIAETFDPGNPWTMMGAEFVGSIFNPVGITLSATKAAAGGGTSGFTMLKNKLFRGEAGAQDVAINEILTVANKVGVSADDLAKSLNQSLSTGNPSGASLPAGQLTGNPVLLGFENNLASQSTEFRGERGKAVADAFSNLRDAAERMLRSGNEEVRYAGKELQKVYFNKILNEQLLLARDAATVAASKFDDADVAGASTAAFEVLQVAKTNARALESSLWGEIPQDVVMDGKGILDAYDSVASRVLADRGGKFGSGETDTIIRNFVDGLRGSAEEGDEAVKAITSGEMLRFRSLMLKQASAAAAAGDANTASVLQEMAEGALVDLSKIPGDAVDAARAYSSSFNERFSAGFPRKALRTDNTRRNAINPEQTLEKGFGGGKPTGELNLRQMDEAAKFGDEAAATLGETATSATDMFSAQEEFLRGTINKLKDPSTGVLDAKRIDTFIANNPDLIEKFPNLKQDMVLSADAQRAADDVINNIGVAATNENLVTTVGQVFSSTTPAADFQKLAKSAPDGDSVSALRNSVVDWSMSNATDAQGNFDFIKFSQNIAQPLTDDGKTALDILIDNGVMSKEQVSGIGAFVEQGLRVQIGSKSPEFIDDIITENSAVINNLARMVGANVGAKANEITGSLFGSPNDSGLQSAAIFSAWAKKIVDAGPQARTRDAMIKLFKDPQLLADAISNSPGVAKKSRLTIKEVLSKTAQLSGEKIVDGAASLVQNRTTTANTLVDTDSMGEDEPLPSSIDNQMEEMFQ